MYYVKLREGEEEENKKATTNEGTGSMVAPVSERSTVVSARTSSNTLNQPGKVLLSGIDSFSQIDSGAKVRFRDEDAKEVFNKNTTESKRKVQKVINKEQIGDKGIKTPTSLLRFLAKSIGLVRAKSTTSYYKTYVLDSTKCVLCKTLSVARNNFMNIR